MRIGELARVSGVTAKTLRYYEEERLLPAPRRSANGYRDYPVETVDRVAFIRHAQAAGLTLYQIGQILAVRDGGQAPCEHAAHLVDQRLEDVEDRLRELQHTRVALRGLRERLATIDPAACGPATVCSAVAAPGPDDRATA